MEGRSEERRKQGKKGGRLVGGRKEKGKVDVRK